MPEMDDKRRRKMIALGVVTFFPLFFIFFLWPGLSILSMTFNLTLNWLYPALVVFFMWQFLLFLGYTIHLFKYRRISTARKIFWILGLLFIWRGPTYWYRYLWCREED